MMPVSVGQERTFRTKTAHDEARRLQTLARANRLLALWAAETMRLDPDQTEAYACELIRCAPRQGDRPAALLRIQQDLRGANLEVTLVELEQAHVNLLTTARDQLRGEDLTAPGFQPAI